MYDKDDLKDIPRNKAPLAIHTYLKITKPDAKIHKIIHIIHIYAKIIVNIKDF